MQQRRRSEPAHQREESRHADRLGGERRKERRQRLRDQQLRGGEWRRQQRLQRASLLLADNRIGGERDGARDRRDQEQQQELLQEERLGRFLGIEGRESG